MAELESRVLLSHFRYANLSWQPQGGNTVEFHLTESFRLGTSSPFNNQSAPPSTPNVGDIVVDTFSSANALNFGDGSAPQQAILRVVSVNQAGNYYVGQAVHDAGGGNFQEGILHTYASAGNVTAFLQDANRLDNPPLQNDAEGTYRVETTVNVGAGNSSPISSLPPVVQAAVGTVATFQVPATDPNPGHTLVYRLATSQEASGGTTYTQPPGLTISPSGLVTWDLRSVTTTPGNLWTSQVVVEDHDASGALVTKTPVDFLIQIVSTANQPPVFDAIPTAPLTFQPGTPLNFVVQGSDPQAANTVSVTAVNPPQGLTISPTTVAPGSRANASAVQATFTATPSQANQSFVVSFLVTSSDGLTAQQSVTLQPGTTAVATTTKLVASPNPSTFGQSVTLTATVAGPPGAATPTGSVTFTEGSTVLGTGTLAGGVASIQANSLAVGTHSIVATYGGTTGFQGSSSTALPVVVNAVPTDGPTVTNLRRFGFHAQPTFLVLSFSGPLDPVPAETPSNYRIVGPVGHRGFGGHLITVDSATYDSTINTVTLALRERLDVHKFYRLTVNGTSPFGLTDPNGVLLDGANNGQPGSNFVRTFGREILAGPASALPGSSSQGGSIGSVSNAKTHVSAKAVDHLLASGAIHPKALRSKA